VTLLRSQWRSLVVAQLVAADTLAGSRVFAARDWPTDPAVLFPIILVQVPHERKESLGRQAPEFNTVVDLVVVGRIETGNVNDAETAIETLCEQIELAILANPAIVSAQPFQQFTYVETNTGFNSEGKRHIGEVAMTFGCELYQWYNPPLITQLSTITTTIEPFGTLGQTLEIQNIFS